MQLKAQQIYHHECLHCAVRGLANGGCPGMSANWINIHEAAVHFCLFLTFQDGCVNG